MKTKFSLLLIVFLLTLLPFLSIFLTPHLLHTSDGGVQIPRMAAFYKAVNDGHIPVRWAGDLNYGYGMPLFIFIYHTPFYLSTMLIFLGVSLILTFKIVLLVSFILSGCFMLLFAREFFKDEKKAFLVVLLYQFAPYHLIDILTRGTIGTIYVYSFFPLLLWGLCKMQRDRKANYLFLFPIVALSTALMILSHNSMALIFFGISVLYILFFTEKTGDKFIHFFALAFGLGLSSFYWIPALIEHKYTYGDLFMKDIFKVNFPPIQNFFIPNVFDSASLRVSEVAVHWGLIHTVAIIGALMLLKKWKLLHNQTKKIIVFNLILIIGCLFFMNPISTPIWERLSFLRQFQFPWRLLSVILFATSFLAGTLLEWRWLRNKYVYAFVCVLVVSATIFYWKPTQGYDLNINEKDFWNYPLNTTYFGETDVIWSAGPAKEYPKSRIEVIDGEAHIRNFSNNTQRQTFEVEAVQDSRIVSHTQYFPGWRVYIGNEKVPVEFQDQNWRGMITFQVPKGLHTISIRFEETPVRLFSDFVSVITLILLCLIPFLKQRYFVGLFNRYEHIK